MLFYCYGDIAKTVLCVSVPAAVCVTCMFVFVLA